MTATGYAVTGYAVYRLSAGPSWHKVSRDFATESQAERYRQSLPPDVITEIREIKTGESA